MPVPEPLRVAIIGSRGYPSTYGGFETFVRRLAPWLAARGHDITVYGRGGRRRTERVVDGVRVVDTRGIDRKAASTPTHGLTASIDCVRWRPDVVLALNIANGPALPLLRMRGIPVVMNVDGIEWDRGKWGPAARRAFRIGARMSARFADVLVADSHEVSEIWAQEFGAHPRYIPYGAEVVEDAPSNRVKALGLAPGTYVLVVARLVPENNVDLLLDALEVLDWDVSAVVVGAANYPNPTEARLKELEGSGRVRWLGHVSDQDLLMELWSHSGAYFHGHSVGGTNPALLQALGCGARVIAIDNAFSREVLGANYHLVPKDAETVAREIRDLLAAPVIDHRVQDHGRSIITSRYSWDSVLTSYESTLRAAAVAGAGLLPRAKTDEGRGDTP